MVFRLAVPLGALQPEARQVAAQRRERALVKESGQVIGGVGKQLAPPDADEQLEVFPLDRFGLRRPGSRGERGMRAAERRRIALEPGQPPQRSGVRRLQQERADQRVFRRARPIDLVAFRCSRRIGVGIKVGSQLRARNAGQSLDGYDMFCRNAFPGRNRGRGYFQCIRNRTNAPNSS